VDGSCEEQGKGPLGTLKVNRSKVTGFGTGIYSSVWGGGQVDINYNTITSQAYGIYVENAGQVMTARDNTIEVGSFEIPFRLSYPITWMVGIEIATWADWAPKKNSSSIYRNEIKMGGLQLRASIMLKVMGFWSMHGTVNAPSMTLSSRVMSLK